MALQHLEAGFAKLQGDDFSYYMQAYSIVIGRNSKKATVDLDLAGGSGAAKNISRLHARLFYDFDSRAFKLQVLGKNGVAVNGELMAQSEEPTKLKSQDLLQIGDKRLYFLLPVPAQENADVKAMPGKRMGSKGPSRASLPFDSDGALKGPPKRKRTAAAVNA